MRSLVLASTINPVRRASSRRAVATLVVLAFLLTSACATVTAGQDPIVVNAERVLKIAPSVYDSAMIFAHTGNVKLSADAANALETFRKTFPSLYRTADQALATYKATKAGDVTVAVTALERALVEANATVVNFGGPALLGGAK